MSITRRRLLAGAAATAAAAAMPAAIAEAAAPVGMVLRKGACLTVGLGAPAATVGSDGDYFVDYSARALWEKVAGKWEFRQLIEGVVIQPADHSQSWRVA